MGVKGLLQRLRNAGITRSVRLSNGMLTYLDADVSENYTDITNPSYSIEDDPVHARTPPVEETDNCNSRANTLNARGRRTGDDRSKLRIGVDASMWIASVCYGMSEMLVDERFLTPYSRAQMEQKQLSVEEQRIKLEEQYTLKCSQSVVDMVLKLRDKCGVPSNHILVVLDGATPPAKQPKCDTRRKRKEDATAIYNGDHNDPALRIRASKMAGAPAHLLSKIKSIIIHELLCHAIPYMVAPYESDSQLMYLSKMGYIDLVLSTDSDMIAMCVPALLCQLDLETGQGQLIRRRDLSSLCDDNFHLQSFTDTMMALLCVAAGCDYCENLPSVGIIRACQIVRAVFGQTDRGAASGATAQQQQQQSTLRQMFDSLYQISSSTTTAFSDEYKETYERNFIEALCMYLHPVVFDPIDEKCIFVRHPITNPDKILLVSSTYYSELCRDHTLEKIQHIVGRLQSQQLAKKIASGWIDPKEK